MCIQLFLKFSMDHFETMHTCAYIEDVHVNFYRSKIIFDKIMAFSTKTIDCLVKFKKLQRVYLWFSSSDHVKITDEA